jgi:hypothetical protein
MASTGGKLQGPPNIEKPIPACCPQVTESDVVKFEAGSFDKACIHADVGHHQLASKLQVLLPFCMQHVVLQQRALATSAPDCTHLL